MYQEFENNFAPASPQETVLHGSARPGYPAEDVEDAVVTQWTNFMLQRGISRVCCLLSANDMRRYYLNDLTSQYQVAFGSSNVLHEPVEDFHIIRREQLIERIFPFVIAAVGTGRKVVVHCSAGQGRTGLVMFAWLVMHRGMDPDLALATVNEMGRNPLETFGGKGDGEMIARRIGLC